jgi:hypothetical protein
MTSAIIAITNKNKTIDYITCSSDGYPEYVGKILKEYYADCATARRLINLGDIYALDKKLDPIGLSHSFDNPETDVTIAYCRDRGEANTEFRTVSSLGSLVDKSIDMYTRYIYLFENGSWNEYIRK